MLVFVYSIEHEQEIVLLYARLYFNVCMSIIHSSIIIIRTLLFHCHKHSQLIYLKRVIVSLDIIFSKLITRFILHREMRLSEHE